MKILVTGANGYIGAHVVSYLLEHTSHEVVAVDFADTWVDSRATFLSRNILADAENPSLYEELGRPEALIHLAWRNGFDHKAESHITDLPGHYLFLKNMIDAGTKSVSVMGSMHEVGYYEGVVTENTPCAPLSLYGIGKNALRQSLLLYAEGREVSVKWLRAYYILGDNARNKSIFSRILGWEKEGKKTFPFTRGTNKYDFISVEKLAEQIAEASVQNTVEGIINVCSGTPVALKDMVEKFIEENGLGIRPEYGVFPDRKYDSPAIWGDCSKINAILAGRG
ncbi:NAD-dependent epimerase/dehydratase family protein [Mailhella massiliensis]|uniref:NAD-dependent epimerase/dehydratase family protein n=1 Tax=Mailhella massiliensis TaxID=1903261 RepID=UPI00097D6932|nr:NAD(P)-dependent oxidoreductase [Mailhella massiliensis]